jgi:hypothetical protein
MGKEKVSKNQFPQAGVCAEIKYLLSPNQKPKTPIFQQLK